MRYPADCLQRTFLSRATNKNASPTDIEKSLGAITAEIYAGYSLACLACVHACVRTDSRYAYTAVVSIILRYCSVSAKFHGRFALGEFAKINVTETHRS